MDYFVCLCGWWWCPTKRESGWSTRFPRYRGMVDSTENLQDVVDGMRQAFQELQFQKPTEYEGV